MYLFLALLSVVYAQTTGYYLSSSSAVNTLRVIPGRPLYLNIFVPEESFLGVDLDTIKGLSWRDQGVFYEGEEFYYTRIDPAIWAERVDGGIEFVGKWWASPRESRQTLEFLVEGFDGPIVVDNQFLLLNRTVLVTCSNGLFCDGIERWVDGYCRTYSRSRPYVCDDQNPCTFDACVEENGGHCLWELDLVHAGCNSCSRGNCDSDCSGRNCGDDGCGGSCGTCSDNFICNSTGSCIAFAGAEAEGTCTNPTSLLGSTESFLGWHTLTGNTAEGQDNSSPSCKVSTNSQEYVYSFTVPAGTGYVGAIFTVWGASGYEFDTVLEVTEGTCDRSNSLGCSDDATPPGGVGSRLELTLNPGTTYYVFVEGSNAAYAGPFQLTSYFVANCLPHCDGNFCSDNGCGEPCQGGCAAGSTCDSGTSRCIADGCVSNCFARNCGSDGCGGWCGVCDEGDYCNFDVDSDGDVIDLGVCVSGSGCDPLNPVCSEDCEREGYCGTDCTCWSLHDEMPDLVAAVGDVVLSYEDVWPTSCSLWDRCVGSSGRRKLLRFSTYTLNQGFADLVIPVPDNVPEWYDYDTCRDQWYLEGFARYVLFDEYDRIIVQHEKQAHCLEDSAPLYAAPYVGCSANYHCGSGSQGIQRGWADEYGNTLDCQWLDITDVPDGIYKLEVHVNYNRRIPEFTTDNNYATVELIIQGDTVTVSAASALGSCLVMLVALCISLLF